MRTTLLLLGFTTGVAQALLLREAMAALGGSEVAWGSVMALWLVGMGAGARAGVRWGSPMTVRWLPLSVIILAAFGIVLFRAAPALIGAAPGETITTWHSLWLWAAAVVPPAFAGGSAFPILAGGLGTAGAGRAYALEAVGAFLGGLALSFVLAPLGAAAAICLGLAVAGAVTIWDRSKILALLVMSAGAVAAMPAGDALSHAGWHWAGHPGALGSWRETQHQRLEISTGPPFSLYADGRLLATYPDVYTTVPRTHALMLLHPEPRRVFALGCIADGSLIPMTRHPVDEIVAVEEDPNLLEMIPRWFDWTPPSGVFDPRVRTTTTDPLRALSSGGPWDLVILLDGNPTTIRRNRTRSLEFFSSCRDHMADDGILVLRLEVADTYLGGSGGRLLEVMVSTLGEVFAQVAAIPGEEILVVAGGPAAEITLDIDELTSRWSSRGLSDPSFTPEMLELLIDPSRLPPLEEAVRNAQAPLNTMNRPRAVLLSAGLLEARARSSLLDLSRIIEGRPATPLTAATGLAAALLLGLAVLRRPPASATSAVVGLCSMGWWLLLIAAWQATLGSVYAEIGALTAAFMGGLAAGAVVASRWSRPARRLPWVLGAGVLLSIVIGTGAPTRLPSLLVPILLLASGSLTGAAFPGLARLAGGESNLERRGAGVAFAADEAGAAAAALVVGIVALPWAGLAGTALGLGVLGAAAIPAVVVRLRRGED